MVHLAAHVTNKLFYETPIGFRLLNTQDDKPVMSLSDHLSRTPVARRLKRPT